MEENEAIKMRFWTDFAGRILFILQTYNFL